MELLTELYTNIALHKDGTELLLTDSETNKLWIAKQNGIHSLVILRDIDNNVIFKGESHLIKEIRIIDTKKEMAKKNILIERLEYEKKWYENRNKKTRWTNNKLKELTDEEIQYFLENAQFKLKNALIKNLAGPKMINEYAMCLMRKYFNCPFL